MLLCHGRVGSDVPVSESEAVANVISHSEMFICEDGLHLMMVSANWNDPAGRELEFLERHRPSV